MLLSTLSQVRELSPLLLEVVAWAMNYFNSWICVSIHAVSSHVVSKRLAISSCLCLYWLYCAWLLQNTSHSKYLWKYFITYPNSEVFLIDVILVVHLTTKHLWCHKIKTKHLSDCTIVSAILIHHYCFEVECVISLCNLAKNLIKQLPEQTDFIC